MKRSRKTKMTDENDLGKQHEGAGVEEGLIEERPPEEVIAAHEKELEEEKGKYLRLYAEFENYKKLAARDKE